MKKLLVVLGALLLIGVGFAIGKMSDDKSYAALTTGTVGSVECFKSINGEPCVPLKQTVILDKTEYENMLNDNARLREELETYKALEAFWSTEALSTSATATAPTAPTARSPYQCGFGFTFTM